MEAKKESSLAVQKGVSRVEMSVSQWVKHVCRSTYLSELCEWERDPTDFIVYINKQTKKNSKFIHLSHTCNLDA